MRVYVDLSIQHMYETVKDAGGERVIDMVSRPNRTTFDLSGNLAFSIFWLAEACREELGRTEIRYVGSGLQGGVRLFLSFSEFLGALLTR
jgi:hypothetical protein